MIASVGFAPHAGPRLRAPGPPAGRGRGGLAGGVALPASGMELQPPFGCAVGESIPSAGLRFAARKAQSVYGLGRFAAEEREARRQVEFAPNGAATHGRARGRVVASISARIVAHVHDPLAAEDEVECAAGDREGQIACWVRHCLFLLWVSRPCGASLWYPSFRWGPPKKGGLSGLDDAARQRVIHPILAFDAGRAEPPGGEETDAPHLRGSRPGRPP